jgi:hypothetical protein
MNWWKTVTRDNLLGLRDFFKQGMDFSVIEEKVSYKSLSHGDLPSACYYTQFTNNNSFIADFVATLAVVHQQLWTIYHKQFNILNQTEI